MISVRKLISWFEKTYRDGLLPRKYAWTVSENATANGTDSVKLTDNGLGPRDVPNDVDVLNGAELRFTTLSVLSSRNGSGVCRPAGRAVAYNSGNHIHN